MWDIEVTDRFLDWYEGTISRAELVAINAAIGILEQDGPALGRPLVDHITTSRHQRMKELRPLGTSIRILFCFDPRRTAILLLGGDKAAAWDIWYAKNIPAADMLYDEYLAELRGEGEI
ncbi:MAG TPA: type II toxin-antitoxin system RelE/ParE family toxin [Chloroflexota bacterium]|nr:type II toxin-antitoxin system RelE/ParE family toxin [Chloroflexota bacterium]